MRMPVSLLLLAFLFISTVSCVSRKEEKKNIKDTWNSYVSAVNSRNGKEAVKYIDQETVKYFDHILDMVRTADSNTVSVMRYDQKIMVLSVRHINSKTEIENYDARGLFAYCVVAGLITNVENEGQEYELQNIIAKDRHGTAQLTNLKSKKVILKVPFSKESGEWKISLAQVYNNIAEDMWRMIIKEYGKTETEMTEAVLSQLNSKAPTNSIWHPVN